MKPILEIDSVHAGYGDVRVLHGVSLTVNEGTITALVGSNGAGKTTLLRTVAGLLPVVSGEIRYSDQKITASTSATRVNRGMALVHEGRILFNSFSVEENLSIGAFSPRIRRRRNDLLAEMYDRYPLLRERRRQLAGTLSGGQQQLVAIARGLMSEPRLLLLDEPSLGLSPQAVDDLFQMIEAIHKTGVTILLVEQNVKTSLALAHDAFVLESGRVALSGPGPQLIDDDRIRQSYLVDCEGRAYAVSVEEQGAWRRSAAAGGGEGAETAHGDIGHRQCRRHRSLSYHGSAGCDRARVRRWRDVGCGKR